MIVMYERFTPRHSLIRVFVMNLITLGAIFAIFNLWLGIPVT